MSLSAGVMSTVAALNYDRVTADVVAALDDAGVEAVLLKGPVLARALYEDGTARPYSDVDVLVSPQRLIEAGAVLDRLGYRCTLSEEDFHDPTGFHAENWSKVGSPPIDLHVSLHGVRVARQALWDTVRGSARTDELFGRPVLVPASAVLALHAMTHAAHAITHADKLRPIEDLRRAVDRFDATTWAEAAELARELHAVPTALAGLLTLGEAGARLAARLDLRLTGDAHQERIDLEQPPALTVGLARIRATHGRERLRLLSAYAWPSPAYMRVTFQEQALSRNALLRAHAKRVLRHTRQLPAAVRGMVDPSLRSEP